MFFRILINELGSDGFDTGIFICVLNYEIKVSWIYILGIELPIVYKLKNQY